MLSRARRSFAGFILLFAVAAILPASGQAVPKFLYVVNYVDDTISAFRIQPLTGQPSPIAGSPFPGIPAMQGIALTPDHRFLYATGYGIVAYSVNAQTGSLTQIGSYSLPNNAGRARITPDGKFLYLVNNGLYGYAIDSSTGALTPVPGSPFNPKTSYTGLSSTPDSAFLYASAVLPNNEVDAFSIQSDGELFPVIGSPYGNPNTPIDIVVEPTGRFVYVADYGDGISGYAINSDGSLTSLPGSPYGTGGQAPNAIFASPNGKAIVVDNQAQSTTASLAIHSDGSLALVGTQPSAYDPGGVTVDPTSEFVYTSSTNGNALAAYRLDPVSQALEIVPGAQWATGRDPYDMTILAAPVWPYCLLNAVEPSVTLCNPTATSASPIRVVAGTTSATPITQLQVSLDGTRLYTAAGTNALDVPVLASAGTHKLVVVAQNQAKQSFSLSRTITVKGSASAGCTNNGIFPMVAVCTPLAGSTTGTSVHVSATSFAPGVVTSTAIYVDGKEAYSVSGNKVNTYVTVSSGVLQVKVQSVDPNGATWSTTVRIVAQ